MSLDQEVADPATPGLQDSLAEQEFANDWRQELLDRTWIALEKMEQETGQPYHAILQFRTKHPDVTAKQMAQRLTSELMPNRRFLGSFPPCGGRSGWGGFAALALPETPSPWPSGGAAILAACRLEACSTGGEGICFCKVVIISNHTSTARAASSSCAVG